MNDKLAAFAEALAASPELKQQITDNPIKTEKDFLALAAQLGIDLSEKDLSQASQELSIEDLDKIAGGDCGWFAELGKPTCEFFFNLEHYIAD